MLNPLPLQFPLRGITENVPYSQLPAGYTFKASNAVGFDPILGRLRGGKRPGTGRAVADPVKADGTPIVRLGQITLTAEAFVDPGGFFTDPDYNIGVGPGGFDYGGGWGFPRSDLAPGVGFGEDGIDQELVNTGDPNTAYVIFGNGAGEFGDLILNETFDYDDGNLEDVSGGEWTKVDGLFSATVLDGEMRLAVSGAFGGLWDDIEYASTTVSQTLDTTQPFRVEMDIASVDLTHSGGAGEVSAAFEVFVDDFPIDYVDLDYAGVTWHKLGTDGLLDYTDTYVEANGNFVTATNVAGVQQPGTWVATFNGSGVNSRLGGAGISPSESTGSDSAIGSDKDLRFATQLDTTGTTHQADVRVSAIRVYGTPLAPPLLIDEQFVYSNGELGAVSGGNWTLVSTGNPETLDVTGTVLGSNLITQSNDGNILYDWAAANAILDVSQPFKLVIDFDEFLADLNGATTSGHQAQPELGFRFDTSTGAPATGDGVWWRNRVVYSAGELRQFRQIATLAGSNKIFTGGASVLDNTGQATALIDTPTAGQIQMTFTGSVTEDETAATSFLNQSPLRLQFFTSMTGSLPQARVKISRIRLYGTAL